MPSSRDPTKAPGPPYVFCYTGSQHVCTHLACQEKTAAMLGRGVELLKSGDETIAAELVVIREHVEDGSLLTASEAERLLETAEGLASALARVQCDLDLFLENREQAFDAAVERAIAEQAVEIAQYWTSAVGERCLGCADGEYVVTEQGVECSKCGGIPPSAK